jgi:hypothetical protein
MEITKNKTVSFILVNVALPVVLSLIVAYAFDKIKAKSEAKVKTASQPPQKVQETIEEEVTTEV